MDAPEKLARVKWAGPNTPFIRITRNDDRIYVTKSELVAILEEINHFIDYYHLDFLPSTINNVDGEDFE